MPILGPQSDIYPNELLTEEYQADRTESGWWIVTTQPRGEKQLLTKLSQKSIPHYCPLIEKRYRSPNGRFRKSYVPLFSNYAFLFCDPQERYESLTTDKIARMETIVDSSQLVVELRQIQFAISSGVPLTPESKLQKGQRVLVKNGPFKGYEGYVLRREGQTRLLLAIDFLEQGVSMEIDECQLEPK